MPALLKDFLVLVYPLGRSTSRTTRAVRENREKKWLPRWGGEKAKIATTPRLPKLPEAKTLKKPSSDILCFEYYCVLARVRTWTSQCHK